MNFWHEVTSAILPVLFTAVMGIVAWVFVQVLDLKRTAIEHEVRLNEKRKRLDKMDADIEKSAVSLREELRRQAEQHRILLKELKEDLRSHISDLTQEVKEMFREDYQNRNPRNRQ